METPSTPCTKNIELYLRRYPEERLAALLAHAQDGKLSYGSCCCLVGALNADHPLRTRSEYNLLVTDNTHYGRIIEDANRIVDIIVRRAEAEFLCLTDNRVTLSPEQADNQRRERLIPLIYAEMARRERERGHAVYAKQEVSVLAGEPENWVNLVNRGTE